MEGEEGFGLFVFLLFLRNDPFLLLFLLLFLLILLQLLFLLVLLLRRLLFLLLWSSLLGSLSGSTGLLRLLKLLLKARDRLRLSVDQLHRSRVPDIQGLDSFLSIGGADHLHLSSALLAHCVDTLAEDPLIEHQAATIRRYVTNGTETHSDLSHNAFESL